MNYTVITFAPVQGFIEKSRKLRDLYGSSYILSLLSWVICQSLEKQGNKVISPALPNVTQGMPNQIVVKGKLSSEEIEKIKNSFTKAWQYVIDSCKEWIVENVKIGKIKRKDKEETIEFNYLCWSRDWQLWVNHCWEFFYASGDTITQARKNLNQKKYSRDWIGINWLGESSTLSGSDAIAYPNLGNLGDLRDYSYQKEKTIIRAFYQELSNKLGESFIDVREELSIPELVKRMITHKTIIDELTPKLAKLNLDLDLTADKIKELAEELNPDTFQELNRHKNYSDEQKYWTGWFLGDGDNASKYFKSVPIEEEATKLNEFSEQMREWGRDLKEKQDQYLEKKGRMIYAGGDDFLGVLYDGAKPFEATDNQAKISPYSCLSWFYNFKSNIWEKPTPKIITASVGFVWAGNQLPQRDILQHCHLAETSAKTTGRDRIALRILFNSGNHLEWVTPWWLLDTGEWNFEKANNNDNKNLRKIDFPETLKQQLTDEKFNLNLIESYRDRNGVFLKDGGNWTHFYQDITRLESRHAFDNRTFSEEKLNSQNINITNDIAFGLIEIYFGTRWAEILKNTDNWFNKYDQNELQTFSGILGDRQQFNAQCEEKPLAREELKSHYKVKQTLNNWIINLAKIGFYLTDKGGKLA